MIKFFYDSYAIIEYLRGNPRYLECFADYSGITTRLNLMEVYYQLLDDPDFAEEVYASFAPFAVEPTDAQLRRAMRWRRVMKATGKNISYADAVGYTLAQEKKIEFLTGDREFKGMEGVRFVK